VEYPFSAENSANADIWAAAFRLIIDISGTYVWSPPCVVPLPQGAEKAKMTMKIERDHGEIYRAPHSWAERNYHKLIYWNEVGKGGHFAAWEEPQLFSEEVRAAFKSLR
jgi:pimeloyl-ACP methyl ester carboxylesterase